MTQCKITVLKRTFNRELAKDYVEGEEEITPCPVFFEGQTFIYKHWGSGEKPQNFCEHAWHDIYKTVTALASGATYQGWVKEDGIGIVCCTDGIRPVVFKVERIASG